MDTIFALSSGRGKAGVAIVRISGAEAVLAFSAFGISRIPEQRQAELVRLTHDGVAIDRALALYFKAPHSFTGEDVVELHLHGSVAVVDSVLKVQAGVKGFRTAEAGEFS